MTQSAKDEAKFLDTRLDDETAAVLEKWNLAILGAALGRAMHHVKYDFLSEFQQKFRFYAESVCF